MKILFPLIRFFKRFSFLYRIIGIVAAFYFFSNSLMDLLFLSSSNKAVPITIEELMSIPQSRIPRYIKLKDVVLKDGSFVETINQKTGVRQSATYPVYSMNQFADYDTLAPNDIQAYVLVNDSHFNSDSLSFIMTIEGKYESSSMSSDKNILEENGIKVSDKAILIIKESPPSFNKSLIISILSLIIGLFIIMSFIPEKFLGIKKQINIEKMDT